MATAPPASEERSRPARADSRALSYAYALWAMGRPLFLLGTIPLYFLGIATAWRDVNSLALLPLTAGLMLAWFIQLATHYTNEYYDLTTDLATSRPTRISGGSRVLVQGIVNPRFALIAAWSSLLLTVALVLVMIFYMGAGYLTLPLIGMALFLGWFYSSPPINLIRRGLGELDIVLESCVLLPTVAYYLQTGALSYEIILYAIPLAAMTFAVTFATELPDRESDLSTGKKTLVVRLGTTSSVRILTGCFIAGWIGFAAISWQLDSVMGLLLTAAGIPLLAAGLVQLPKITIGDASGMERLGLVSSISLGYVATALTAIIFLAP